MSQLSIDEKSGSNVAIPLVNLRRSSLREPPCIELAHSAFGLILACSLLLAACGSGPPSTEQANVALKELPQMQFLLGSQVNNPSLRLVSDMTCDKSGDQKFKCQVLLPKNPLNGSQETLPVEFVKLEGKWRAISAE